MIHFSSHEGEENGGWSTYMLYLLPCLKWIDQQIDHSASNDLQNLKLLQNCYSFHTDSERVKRVSIYFILQYSTQWKEQGKILPPPNQPMTVSITWQTYKAPLFNRDTILHTMYSHGVGKITL